METSTLEETVTEDATSDLRCQSRHHLDNRRIEHECQITPVAIFNAACMPGPGILVCKTSMDIAIYGMTLGGLCLICDKPLPECWSITPLVTA